MKATETYNEIVRQTTVFADGSMCIMAKRPDGKMNVEWRKVR